MRLRSGVGCVCPDFTEEQMHFVAFLQLCEPLSVTALTGVYRLLSSFLCIFLIELHVFLSRTYCTMTFFLIFSTCLF